MNADFTSTGRPLHHLHKFTESLGFGLVPSLGFVTVICYHEDCYEGLDRNRYPPENIGPKLFLEPQR